MMSVWEKVCQGVREAEKKTDRQTYKQVDKQTGLPKRDMHKMTNISEKIRSCSHVSKHQVFFVFHRLESRHKTRFVGLSSRHSDIHTQSGISKHGDTVSSYYSCSSPPAGVFCSGVSNLLLMMFCCEKKTLYCHGLIIS